MVIGGENCSSNSVQVFSGIISRKDADRDHHHNLAPPPRITATT